MKTEILELRGIPRKYFVKYFYDIGGKTTDDSIFYGDYWQVELSEEKWSKLTVIEIQSTIIKFEVTDDEFDQFIYQFRLSFLRGGG